MSSSEDSKHYISDQDSSDESPQISSIIKEKSKIFQNESFIIKILLTDHFRQQRAKFFSLIRRHPGSIYQAIKKEIRNCLNPYRIFIEKEAKTSEQLKELYNLLKSYFKEKNFNNTFFINYFKDLEKAHKKKSKYLSMLPSDEVEVLNDLQRKVAIIRALRHYVSTTIRDRIQINYDKKKGINMDDDDFTMMYEYLVINPKEYSNMDYSTLSKYISNERGSFKLRRPLNDFNTYNYLPILCKGYCQKEAELFIQFFARVIQSHGSECKKCKELSDNLNAINKQIKSLYTKTCIFSHNINEIMFHPLIFFSFKNTPFYLKQLAQPQIKEIKNLVNKNAPSKKYQKIKKNFDIRKIYIPSDNGMKEIFNKLKEYALKTDLFGNCCYLQEFKTKPCPIDLIRPNDKEYDTHKIKCPYYHCPLEKRRNIKIKQNEICKEVIKDGKWKTDEINCEDHDECEKYHTRNELFYDKRNFRRLYPCSSLSSYCQKGSLCPRKHPIDIKVEEIYLPLEEKSMLERDLKKLINKNTFVQQKEKKLAKIQCKSCLNYINGKDGRNLYFFKNCMHSICSNCYDVFKSCPLCGFNKNNFSDEDNLVFINLDYENENLSKMSENSNYDEENEENEEEEEEENEEGEGEGEESKSDKDLKDPDDDENEVVINSYLDFNRILTQISCDNNNGDEEEEDEDDDEDKKEDKDNIESTISKENKSQKSKNNNRSGINYEDNEENSSYYNSSSYSNSSRGRKRGGRGNIRARGGRGRGGERGGRGGRGRRNY